MRVYLMIGLFIISLIAGCIADGPAKQLGNPVPQIPERVPDGNTPVISSSVTSPIEAIQPTSAVLGQYDRVQSEENYSEAVEVDYRKYVDWFLSYNINIRGYTPDEYVCGQYTVDMINASKKAGFKAYFGAIRFSDGTGYALVAFKSTFSGYTSWYFFEPQTNNRMTPETIKGIFQENIGKTVTEVTVYGYFDDAADKDPTTWRFGYQLYNKKY